MNNSKDNIINAATIGFAIGDALGVPVEFVSREELAHNKIVDMVGFGSHRVPAGTWSDDTSMLIATMDSINRNNGIDYEDIIDSFCKWYLDHEYTATGVVFDIGNATSAALTNRIIHRLPATECGLSSERSNGNGSLMRILPVAFYLHGKNIDEEQSIEIVNNISSLTHSHPISMLGCNIYVDYIRALLDGYDKSAAYNVVKKKNYEKYYQPNILAAYSRILKDDISNLKEDDIKSSGYVVSSLEAALWTILKTTTFEESVIKAVNLGNDTDTIGALTGGIAGIIYGLESIPTKWKSALKKYEYLDEIACIFSKSILNEENSLDNIQKKNGRR